MWLNDTWRGAQDGKLDPSVFFAMIENVLKLFPNGARPPSARSHPRICVLYTRVPAQKPGQSVPEL